MDHLKDQDIKTLVQTVAKRVVKALKKFGHFQDESEALAEEPEDAMAELQAASVKNREPMSCQKARSRWVGDHPQSFLYG